MIEKSKEKFNITKRNYLSISAVEVCSEFAVTLGDGTSRLATFDP